eukprot:PhM_4_TR5474/c0_g1_i1/m.17981
MYTLHALGVGLIITIILLATLHRDTLTDDFQYHPLCSVIALYTIVPLSLHAHSKARAAPLRERSYYVRVHAFVSMLFLLFCFFSLVGVETHKLRGAKSHFKSWHSVFGGIAFMGFLAQVMLGLVSLYPNSPGISLITQSGVLSRTTAWKWHRVLFRFLLLFWSVTYVLAISYTNYGTSKLPSSGLRSFVIALHFLMVALLYASKAMAPASAGTASPGLSSAHTPTDTDLV